MSPSDFLRSVVSSCFLAARTLLYSPPNTATDFQVPIMLFLGYIWLSLPLFSNTVVFASPESGGMVGVYSISLSPHMQHQN